MISIIKQWIHWIWKTFLYWILLSNELLAWFFEFLSIINVLIRSFEMKTTLRIRIRDEKTSWRLRLSFTIVNVFFFMRKIMRFSCKKWLFFALLIMKTIASIDSRFKSNFCAIFFEIHRKRSSFVNEKCCKS
jgi:hypothetical protein